ncbi:MAG TPA: sulfatase-like hydrolase/transferase [Candidatus Ozemobacteraceae bacterium]|nr:sulfatase-like hydrolase/transferase [Candidatus Ozemobacteraceae bacterium]
MKASQYFHPLFFSVYPVLYLYARHQGTINPADTVLPLLVCFFSAVAALLFFRLLSRDGIKASLSVTVLCFAMFSFGSFDSLFFGSGGFDSSRTFWFPLVWLIGNFVAIALIMKSRGDNTKANSFLNFMALAMMIMSAGGILYTAIFTESAVRPVVSLQSGPENISDEEKRKLPDVFYLILDGYARQDTLQRLYGFDNSEFMSFLSQSGFFIASQSYANYPQTYLSLASSLNFTYLDSLADQFSDTNSVQPLVEMIQNNRLFEILKKWGYRTVAFSSGYSGTEIRNADAYISRSILGREFLDTLINMTFLVALKLPFFDLSVSQADIHRERIQKTLQEIPELDFSEPACVFAHIICPHPPFVFAADGKPLDQTERFTLFDGNDWGSDKEAYRKLYAGQLLYLNRLVKKAVENILNRTGRPKIIVIQADHGPGSKLDWRNIGSTDLKERFGILNAIYFSDGDYSRLYPEITPINTFRRVVNRVTGEKLDSLPDRSFFAPWIGRYRLVEITEKLH